MSFSYKSVADSFDCDAWQGYFLICSLAWRRQFSLVDIVVPSMPLNVFEIDTVAIEGGLMDRLTLNATLGLLGSNTTLL